MLVKGKFVCPGQVNEPSAWLIEVSSGGGNVIGNDSCDRTIGTTIATTPAMKAATPPKEAMIAATIMAHPATLA
jgi:hypothetical protein